MNGSIQLAALVFVGLFLAWCLFALAAYVGWRLAQRAQRSPEEVATAIHARASRTALASLERTAARAEALAGALQAGRFTATGPVALPPDWRERVATVRALLRRLRAGGHATPVEIGAAAGALEGIPAPEAEALLELLGRYAATAGGEAAAAHERARLVTKRRRLEAEIFALEEAGAAPETIEPLRRLHAEVVRTLEGSSA